MSPDDKITFLRRQEGDECQDCWHSRRLHDVEGALGACTRLGCSCNAYTVITLQRKVSLGASDLWVVTEERVLFRQHRGYLDLDE